MSTDTASRDSIVAEALIALLRHGHSKGAFGFLVEARPGFPLERVLETLHDEGEVYVSLVGSPDHGLSFSETVGERWANGTIGYDATHAVQVRNDAPSEALKVVIVWSEEARLHSLARRGYQSIGADELVQEIATMGCAAAPNQPQRNLWKVLATSNRPVTISLDSAVAYFVSVFGEGASPQDGPRDSLPKLGLLTDSQLLGNYSSEQQIRRRLVANAEMVARLQTGDRKDRDRALRSVENAPPGEQAQLRTAYKAFLRLSRGESEAINDLDLDLALRLFRQPNTQITDDTDDRDPIDAPGGDPPGGNDNDDPRASYEDVELAALELALRGDESELFSLTAAAQKALEADEIKDCTLKTQSVIAAFHPNVRAIVLARDTLRTDRLGGTISGAAPVDTILREIGRFVSDVRPIDNIDLERVKTLATRGEDILPEFEGGRLLNEYLEARSALLPHIDLLVTIPFATIAGSVVKEKAKHLVTAYKRLVDHLEQQYPALRRVAADGARALYRSILSFDVILIEGEDETAALVAPTHPLVLWKYLEIADLCEELGAAIEVTDRQLLLQELRDLPEPLSAIFLPSLQDDPELGYVGRRVGAFPLYRAKATETADVSRETIERAGQKLLALYPIARRDLRLLLVDPVNTREASRAAKALVEKEAVAHVTLIVARTSGALNIGASREDSALDELNAEGKLDFEEIPATDIDGVLREVAVRPVHLLIVSGQEEKGVEAIEREASRLHPLSIPHRLHADQLTNRVSLKPRSLQPEEGTSLHPFALYQELVAAVAGSSQMDRTMAQSRRVSLSDLRPLLPHCLFLCAAGIPEEEHDLDLMRLSQGSGALGDSTFTVYGNRIIEGIDRLLRKLNYEPKQEGIKRLIDHLEEIAADEIFATISEKGSGGFSEPALKGLLGLAVALGWYKSTAAQDEFLVVSVDTFLARQWLGKRPDGKRVDLIGFRKDGNGDVHVDVIEVKSYDAGGNDPGSSYPAEQLLAVATVLHQIFNRKGDVLTDRRRELLRRQVYYEGLLVRVGANQAWVDALNDVLDGDQEVKVNLKLIELHFAENFGIQKETFVLREPESRIDGLPGERLRLGEKEIQRQLADYALQPLQVESTLEVDVPTYEEPTEAAASGRGDAGDVDLDGYDSAPPVRDDNRQIAERKVVSELAQEGQHDVGQVDSQPVGFEPSAEERADIEELAKRLYRALRDVGIQIAEPIDPSLADIGPTIVRFKVKLRPEERTANLRKRARDIMRELAADKEPIIDVLPNTSFVYVDIPRPKRRVAPFNPDWARHEARHGGLTVPFGVAPEGGLASYDIADLPHMLVAGATGSGKTMFLYSLIAALHEAYSAEEVELVLVDPKQTDFVYFEGLSLLRGRGVITDPQLAIEILQRLLNVELEERTSVLKNAKARDISSYNARDNVKIPRIVVVIDEFADLADIMEGSERDDFDASLRRLAQRARNVGIHLVLATQRPTTDIINGTIKANLPCRVSFRLSSHVDSQTILDVPGAEKLLGNGDMLVSWNGELRRLQGLFVDEEYLLRL
jgi:hypothetical protein